MNLFPYFFGDMAELGWPGQFNLDFMFMLSLSALWVAWRHEFSDAGLALDVLAFFGGALFLSIHLLLATRTAGGDARVVLVGSSRGLGRRRATDSGAQIAEQARRARACLW